MLFMIVEHFRGGDPVPVYERFRLQGRLAPEGLRYVTSWVTSDLTRCYQLMECVDRGQLDPWLHAWSDLVEFEVHPVITSAEAAARVLASAGKENSSGVQARQRAVHVLIFDGFADWEPAHALAELRRWGKRVVRTVGFTSAPVVSMGGLTVSPDIALDAVRVNDVELLLLPGGDMWEQATYPRQLLDPLIKALVAEEIPVAAICAATLALGRAGVLDTRRHTSNGSEYLHAHLPDYAGAPYYIDTTAVRDQHVITASGLAPVDFAREVFAELHIFNAADEALWFSMFKEGRAPSLRA